MRLVQIASRDVH